ncbi:nipped-B-like protein A isoform X2 [Mytilus trossulus]|uniref:nipped-B-like protein A isoform X2 n=1 Tax=Mytilus trossulus TaxID=6551 RepID=UPI00300735F7
MNGEVPSVPITTLAGISSLTDLLPELPLPTPIPSTVNNRSLLHNSKVAEGAKRLLQSKDDFLAKHVCRTLCQTTTDEILLKDNHAGDGIEGDVPPLLRSVLAQNPHVFRVTRSNSKKHSPQNNDISVQQKHPKFNQKHGSNKSQDSAKRRSGSNKFQDSFLNFTESSTTNDIGAMNGEHPDTEHAEYPTRHNSNENSKVVSPAQGSVAESVTRLNSKELEMSEKWRKIFDKGPEPRVVLEPLGSQSQIISPSLKPPPPKEPKAVVLLEMLDEKPKKKKKGNKKQLKTLQSSGSVKTKSDRRSHSSGNKRSYYEESDDDDGRNRRKKRRQYDSDEESEPPSPVEVKKKKKDKRRHRMQQELSIEELLDSPTFKKFSSCIETIFDSAEDVNFGSLDPNDEETEIPEETLIAKSTLAELCGEAAKLKTMGVLNQVPAATLIKLLTILQWNVRDGSRITPIISANDMEDEDEQRLWRELTMERVMRSMDAALTATYIMSAKSMPKQVYIEDVIERILLFGKFQLLNSIYPEFDPVYRIDKKKDAYTSSKAKRARAGQVKHKSSITLYNKMAEMISNLSEILEIQELTDTTILQVSTLGVGPFFVENISEIQLNAMKLVTTVFSRYEKHRQLILEDIFASLARLPSSKRNLRNYRLNSEESIQMVTALALQLIQSVVTLPQPKSDNPNEEVSEEEVSVSKKNKSNQKAKHGQTDTDLLIVTSFENAMRTAHNFLSVFLQKCTVKGEEDYRPLFENFVQDLLSTVNKPEWPSSELLLSLLGRILVKQFSNKSVDMSLRVASLEYLGIVASRLRKDAVSSQLNQESIDEIVAKVNEDDTDDEESSRSTRGNKKTEKSEVSEDPTQTLQESMLDFLASNSENEPAYWHARSFYIAQWYRDTTVEAEKKMKASGDHEDEFDETEVEISTETETMENQEKRKKFLLSQINSIQPSDLNFRPPSSKLDDDNAGLVARYLSSKRPFAQSFDIYLTQILRVLSENAVAVRTKAMKCLTAVVEADPGILARNDMQKGVHGRFLDQSTSVREAAVELVGRFILIRPELIPDYFQMLSDRILDTGISVRKRVIKIFREICIEQSDFPKIPDMCVKMIRRVNDEEGIKKLVNEVFQTMWFTALSNREKDSSKLLQRVVNITEVVAAIKDNGYEFFEQLLENLLKKDENGHYNKNAVTSCRQIVDCLVENVLRLEEKSVDQEEGKGCSQRLVACLSTLYLFSKIKPDLMVKHAETLQPYLDIKCSAQGDYFVLHYIAKILELVVPLMEHPSESFLAQLEEDMMKLILKHGMMVLQSCVSCLGAVVNCVSHNFALVKDCFQKFFGLLTRMMVIHKSNPRESSLNARKPTLNRSLFTVGLFCKHFDFDSKEMGETKENEEEVSIREKVFDVLYYFVSHEDLDVQEKALAGLGFLVVRHYEFMMHTVMREMYYDFLTNTESPVRLKIQVLKNLQYYLNEEEIRMQISDQEWKKHAKQEDLKEMGDVQSGMASTIMQIYLKQVLESFFHQQTAVRTAALNVICLVLRQGLIHPVQCVPYLISFCTDSDNVIRAKADSQLEEIEKKYPGFIHMKALQGLKMSYKLQEFLINNKSELVRGMRNCNDHIQSLNSRLYSVLRTNRSHRRAILTSLLNTFDDSSKISLQEQVYIADNLAYFPYLTQDEPLFIINQIDIIVSVSGSNLLQSFKEKLLPSKKARAMSMINNGHEEGRKVAYDEDDDDFEAMLERLPEYIDALQDIIKLSQGCILLLHLKQHLKETYGFTDSKVHNYSPAETKTYDKPVNRKTVLKFQPQTVLKELQTSQLSDEEAREKLVSDYVEFKELMLSIDPPDEDESDEAKSTGRHTPTPGRNTPTPGRTAPRVPPMTIRIGDDGVVVPKENEDTEMIVENNEEGADNSMKWTPKPSKHHHHHHHSHHSSSSHKKKSSRTLIQTISVTPKSVSKKKKKKRKRYGSDSDSDNSDDPDFVC